MSTKQFTVVFIAADGAQIIKTIRSNNRGQAIASALEKLDADDRMVLGINEEGRAIDAKHWPLDDAGFPMKAAQTEGLVLRTVTTVERVTA